jgi:tetratricopeptide (TPR) repeat protein
MWRVSAFWHFFPDRNSFITWEAGDKNRGDEMRNRAAFFGRWSRLVAVSVVAVTAATAIAQKAPPAFRRSPDDCFKYPVTLPGDQMRKIADDCEVQFRKASKLPADLANAGLNSGSAHNSLREFDKAAAILETVTQDERARADTRSDAKYQLARAYTGQAQQAAAPDKSALYGKAIGALDDLLGPSGVKRGSPLYSSVVYQRAAAYQSRGGGTLDYNNAIDGFSTIADGGPGVDPVLVKDARQNLISVALKAGASELTPSTSNSPAAQRAAGFYEKALKYDPKNIDLNIGLGDARLVIAGAAPAADKAGWYAQARDAYAQAGVSGPKASAANAGLARASHGLDQLPESIGYYKAAMAGDGSNAKIASELADTQVEYARGLKDPAAKPAAYRDAEQTYQTLLQQPGQSASAKAAILMSLANVQGQQPGRTDDVRKTLLAAIAADPTSVSAPLQVGMSLYNQQNFVDAGKYFQQVINMTGGADGSPGPNDIGTKADAYYYLSLIADRNGAAGGAAALTDGVNNANEAIKLGTSRTPYREQVCISRILRGGTSVTGSDSSTACGSSDQPPGMLLLGMFNLRKARFTSTALRPAALEVAQVWFDQGLREAERSAATPNERERRAFKWPGSAAAPSMQTMMKYGKAKVVSCSGLSIDSGLTAEELGVARKFFEFYGVDSCEHL